MRPPPASRSVVQNPPDTWYPNPADYWVRPEDADKYPQHYGDAFAAPDVNSCKTDSGTPWAFAQVLMPSCELGAKGKATSLNTRSGPTGDRHA